MAEQTYKIRKSFVIPFTLDVILMGVLVSLVYFWKGSTVERGVLTLFFIPLLFVLWEIFIRKITITDEALTIKKYFRVKKLSWDDITHVGCLVIRSKVYILLTTKRGLQIISNAYERFPNLIQSIISHLPSPEIEVEKEARDQIENPVRNTSDLVAAWIAAVILAAIIWVKINS
ncbi:MAG: hypothetical protein N2317_06420 [Syntrophales bacterium]|nr:hypothetical protein [Syntrophales bacterium]